MTHEPSTSASSRTRTGRVAHSPTALRPSTSHDGPHSGVAPMRSGRCRIPLRPAAQTLLLSLLSKGWPSMRFERWIRLAPSLGGFRSLDDSREPRWRLGGPTRCAVIATRSRETTELIHDFDSLAAPHRFNHVRVGDGRRMRERFGGRFAGCIGKSGFGRHRFHGLGESGPGYRR